MTTTAIGLQVQDLRVVYDGFAAVDGVSFEVAPGESFGIVGESGSGKSTVLRAICGLAPRSGGQVRLTGAGDLPAPGSKAFRRQVQMVFQDPYGSLHPRQTVDRILAEPLAIHGIGQGDERQIRIAQALEEVGLGQGFRFRYPHQLSGGQRHGLSFVMVSHDLAVVTHLCQRLMVMRRGQVVEQIAAEDLAAQRVKAAYTRELMQASAGFRRAAA